MTTSVYAIQALLLVHFHSILANLLPRGVPPEFAPFYVPSENFICLDKSATHPWSRVNDDYCDCRDGSDEPGTSACLDMKFYCENAGHKSKFIFSSFVNDKVCDCCDGSDEYLGYVNCSNTCGHLAEAHKADLIRIRQNVEKGHEIYKEYVARKVVELEEQARRDAEAEEERLEREKLVSPPPAEPPVQPEAETPPTQEPRPSDQTDESSDLDTEHNESFEPPDYSESSGVEGFEEHTGTEEPAPPPPPPKPIDYGPEQGFLMLTEPDVGCLELEDKEYVYSLCPFKDAHQRSRSAGSSSLLGNWKGWVDHPEGSEEWDMEAKMKLPYKEMLYDNGHSCWNGPNRSVKVRVECGPENKLLSADEPSRCSYRFRLQTPAACHHHPDTLLAHMHTEL
ncbi:hypothetical protein AAHC03_026711 [Spirometra sp. Aus1]